MLHFYRVFILIFLRAMSIFSMDMRLEGFGLNNALRELEHPKSLETRLCSQQQLAVLKKRLPQTLTNNDVNRSTIMMPFHQAKFSVFNYSGAFLATIGQDKIIKLWKTNSGKEYASFIGHQHGVVDAQFSSNDQYLATASNEGVFIWSIVDRMLYKKIPVQGEIMCLHWLKDNKKVLIGGKSFRTIIIADIDPEVDVYITIGNNFKFKPCELFSYAKNANLLAVASEHTIFLINIDKKSFIGSVNINGVPNVSGRITALLLSENGNFLTAADNTCTVYIWDVETLKCITCLNELPKERVISSLCWDSLGKMLCMGLSNNTSSSSDICYVYNEDNKFVGIWKMPALVSCAAFNKFPLVITSLMNGMQALFCTAKKERVLATIDNSIAHSIATADEVIAFTSTDYHQEEMFCAESNSKKSTSYFMSKVDIWWLSNQNINPILRRLSQAEFKNLLLVANNRLLYLDLLSPPLEKLARFMKSKATDMLTITIQAEDGSFDLPGIIGAQSRLLRNASKDFGDKIVDNCLSLALQEYFKIEDETAIKNILLFSLTPDDPLFEEYLKKFTSIEQLAKILHIAAFLDVPEAVQKILAVLHEVLNPLPLDELLAEIEEKKDFKGKMLFSEFLKTLRDISKNIRLSLDHTLIFPQNCLDIINHLSIKDINQLIDLIRITLSFECFMGYGNEALKKLLENNYFVCYLEDLLVPISATVSRYSPFFKDICGKIFFELIRKNSTISLPQLKDCSKDIVHDLYKRYMRTSIANAIVGHNALGSKNQGYGLYQLIMRNGLGKIYLNDDGTTLLHQETIDGALKVLQAATNFSKPCKEIKSPLSPIAVVIKESEVLIAYKTASDLYVRNNNTIKLFNCSNLLITVSLFDSQGKMLIIGTAKGDVLQIDIGTKACKKLGRIDI